MKKRVVIFIIVLMILAGGGTYQYYSILHVGEHAEPQPADVIIVLGAAVWPQGPSPALQARIYYATRLYHEGYADKLILSGGLGENPPTEAEAMAVAASVLDVKADAMYLEKEARNTRENLAFSKNIMEENNWETAIIVTDVFHIKRALLIAGDLGLSASGAPAKNSVLYHNRNLKIRYTIREVLALTNYYLFNKS